MIIAKVTALILWYQGQKVWTHMSLLISGWKTLGPAKHEEVAIYAVNQRIPNVLELQELLWQRSNS